MLFRTLLSAGLVAAMLPAGLAAQGRFEGVITLRTGTTKGNGVEDHLYVKGSRVRLERGENTVIWDQDGRQIAIRNAARQYVVLGTASQTKPSTLRFEPTGRSETVAGYPCKYYKIVDSSDKARASGEGCVTMALGFVKLGPGALVPADERTLRGQFRDGFLLLKVLDQKGVAASEVTQVERRSLSDALFAPPAGYTEMKLRGGMTPQRP